MKTKDTKSPPSQIKSRHVRTFFASILGILALLLVFLSILAVWANQTLTNNTILTNTVAPLASNVNIQNYVAQKTTSVILNNGPSNIAPQLLSSGQISGKTNSQITDELNSEVNGVVLQIVRSPNFASLWRTTVSNAHSQFLSQLKSNSSSLNVNLHPAIDGILAQLKTTKLNVISNQINVSNTDGVLNVKGNVIGRLRQFYKIFENATLAIVTLTIIFIGLSVWISVNHLKTVRRILVGSGIVSLFIAIALKIPAFFIGHSGKLQQKATLAIVNALLHGLFVVTAVVGIVLIAAGIGSKIYSERKANHLKSSARKTVAAVK